MILPLMRIYLCCVVFFLLFSLPVYALDCKKNVPCAAASGLSFLSKIAPNTQGIDDVFGGSTDINNSTAMIGAPWDSGDGYHSGAVYVYEQKEGHWVQTGRLQSKSPTGKALFGSSIALKGDKLLVGAPGERQGKLTSAGAVYIFEKNSKGVWQQQARLVADNNQAGDFFGNAVAWAGTDAVVGAHLHDGKAIDSGMVYIFRQTAAATSWQQITALEPTDGKAGTLFGNALDADDTRLIVGAYGHEGQSPSGGAVYVYTKTRGQWTYSTMLQPSARRAFAESDCGRTLRRSTK
jgi:hypothetical protein